MPTNRYIDKYKNVITTSTPNVSGSYMWINASSSSVSGIFMPGKCGSGPITASGCILDPSWDTIEPPEVENKEIQELLDTVRDLKERLNL